MKLYIDRDLQDVYKGWGWVEVLSTDMQRFRIPTAYPKSYEKMCRLPGERYKVANGGNLPSRGRAGSNKFVVEINSQTMAIRAQKTLTVAAVRAWVATWAGSGAKLITPGKRVHALDGGTAVRAPHFVYFILNEESRAIKIGRARDVAKRLKTLQTSSPAPLKSLGAAALANEKAAADFEAKLHAEFADIRLTGEWFRAEAKLLERIRVLVASEG
jgi:hypothetical protein